MQGQAAMLGSIRSIMVRPTSRDKQRTMAISGPEANRQAAAINLALADRRAVSNGTREPDGAVGNGSALGDLFRASQSHA